MNKIYLSKSYTKSRWMIPWHLYKYKKKFFDRTSSWEKRKGNTVACLAIIEHWTKDYISNKPLIFHKAGSCNTVHTYVHHRLTILLPRDLNQGEK